jgi:hypothetical protein
MKPRTLKISPLFIFIILFSNYLLAQPGDSNLGMSKPMFIPAEKTIQYKIGDRTLPIKVVQYGELKDIVCINLHDNEESSLQAARSVLESSGGTLIKMENNNQRVIRFRLKGISYGFDPNRMFSRIGIEQTLRDNRRSSKAAIDEIEKFAQRLLLLFPDSISCIVALHNNTEGAFSIKSYLPGGNRQSDAQAVYADSLQDIDDIVLTTDSLLYQKMADNKFNSIWQDNNKAKKDGSLSIFCGERNLRYINIETQHGKVNQYIKMLEKLLEILAEENKIMPEYEVDGQ